MSKLSDKSSKFKVGDHVVVITKRWDDDDLVQYGAIGVVATIRQSSDFPVQVKYDNPITIRNGGISKCNSYDWDDLELSELAKSPLWRALS